MTTSKQGVLDLGSLRAHWDKDSAGDGFDLQGEIKKTALTVKARVLEGSIKTYKVLKTHDGQYEIRDFQAEGGNDRRAVRDIFGGEVTYDDEAAKAILASQAAAKPAKPKLDFIRIPSYGTGFDNEDMREGKAKNEGITCAMATQYLKYMFAKSTLAPEKFQTFVEDALREGRLFKAVDDGHKNFHQMPSYSG